MNDLDNNPVASQEPPTTPGASPETNSQSLLPSQSHQTLPAQPAGNFPGWDTIDEGQNTYTEEDCLHPCLSLICEKLEDRGDDGVVIYDYSLDPGYPPRPATQGYFGQDDDLFFQVSKDELFQETPVPDPWDQIANPQEEDALTRSRGQRLAIIDFPQCYDTEDAILELLAGKLDLNPKYTTAFKDEHSKRVLEHPGRTGFRTGISLRVPFEPSGDKLSLFVSIPYFGTPGPVVTLDSTSESVTLSEFKQLKVHVPNNGGLAGEEERDEIGEMLVHQARYMVFDNHTMATFRSKEDSAKDQIPLHRFQERIGAFRALVHMIANRMDMESSVFEKFQLSLGKLEQDIDQMISDAKTYEDNQGMKIDPIDNPQKLKPTLPVGTRLTQEEALRWEQDYERARQNNVQKRKQKRVRDLLTSLNRLSAGLFAAISVSERQIAVLQDLHSVLSTSFRTKTKDYEKRYPLRRNPFYKNITSIPILAENAEQIWPNTLEAIEEVVQERKSFIKKVKDLIKNMDIRRKILSVFLKSDQAKAAPSDRTAQEAADAMKRTEETIKKTQATLVQQAQTLSGFTIVTTAFLPLSFCASYFGMNNITEFNAQHTISVRDFWLTTGPICAGIILLTVIIIVWKRPMMAEFKLRLREKLWPSKEKLPDVENGLSTANLSEGTQAEEAKEDASGDGGGATTPDRTSTAPRQMSRGPPPLPESGSRNLDPPGTQPEQSSQELESNPPLYPEPEPVIAPSRVRSQELPSPQPQSPTGTSSTNPNRASVPLSSVGEPSTSSLPSPGQSSAPMS